MLLKGLLLVIDDVAVLNFCRQSEERIMAEVRFCAHVLVVSWTYYLNIVLAYGFVHHTDFLVCQSACIAYFLKTFLVATDAEAFADDSDFAVFEHLVAQPPASVEWKRTKTDLVEMIYLAWVSATV